MTPDDHTNLEQPIADLKERLWAATNAAGWGDISWGEVKALRFEVERMERERIEVSESGDGAKL